MSTSRAAAKAEIAALLNDIEPHWRRYFTLYPRDQTLSGRLDASTWWASGDIHEHWGSRGSCTEAVWAEWMIERRRYFFGDYREGVAEQV